PVRHRADHGGHQPGAALDPRRGRLGRAREAVRATRARGDGCALTERAPEDGKRRFRGLRTRTLHPQHPSRMENAGSRTPAPALSIRVAPTHRADLTLTRCPLPAVRL